MKKYKVYCNKKYYEINFMQTSLTGNQNTTYTCVFDEGIYYDVVEENIYVTIIDGEKRELRFNRFSPFAIDKYPIYFSNMQKLRKEKLKKIDECR